MTDFRVIASEAVRQQLHKLITTATLEGRGPVFLAAYGLLVQRLRRSPLEFGELQYYLHQLQLQMRRAAVAPILVNCGVNQEKGFVVVQAFALMDLPGR